MFSMVDVINDHTYQIKWPSSVILTVFQVHLCLNQLIQCMTSTGQNCSKWLYANRFLFCFVSQERSDSSHDSPF